MSADVLREAAALMRERAEAATPGRWIANGFEYDDRADLFTYDVSAAADPVTSLLYATGKDNAEHVASWHPAVALAVADWLDREARIDECAREYGKQGTSPDHPAVAVARAYLGRTHE